MYEIAKVLGFIVMGDDDLDITSSRDTMQFFHDIMQGNSAILVIKNI